MKIVQLFPSLISADVLHLGQVITELEPYCDGFHLDVMDFNAVSNLTWGPSFINVIARATTKQLFIHLMINNSSDFIKLLILRPKDIVSFHIEEKTDHKKLANSLVEKKIIPSIAINPKTPLNALFSLFDTFTHVLLMSVEPGFSGQQFIPDSLDRLKELNTYREEQSINLTIAMDGGINKSNLVSLIQNGLDQACIASGIFDHPDPISALKNLRHIAGSL